MAFTLAPYAFLQFFDDNGNPLSGGKLHTYAGGSSTPKTTYADAEGVSENTNPIVLDSAGRTKYWLGDGAYKLVLKDSSDVQIGDTIDNVVAASPTGQINLMSDLRSLTPGIQSYVETLGYYAVGDGGNWQYIWNAASTATDDGGSVIQPNSLPATGRWLMVNNEDYINLKAFGCRCDDSTDDLTQFVKCDTYAVANNLRIVMTEGSCVISADPTIVAPLEMQTNAILKYDSFQPTITPIIEESDNTQHFDIVVGDVPVLDIPIFRPEWFGENQTTHPIMTACIAASTLTRSYIHRLILPDDENIGCESDDNLLQISDGILHVNGDIRIDNSANIGIDSDTNLLQLIDSLLVVNGAILGTNIKIADYDIYESATDSVASLRLNYHGYVGGTTQFRDLYIGDGKNTAIAYFEGSTKTITLAGNIQISDDSNIGIDSDVDLLQLTSGTLVVNGSLRLDNSANIGIDSDTNLLQLIDNLLVVNGDILSTNIKIADYDIYESATDSNASLRLNYHGYVGGTTQFRDLYIGDGKNAALAYFEGSTKTCTLAGNIQIGDDSNIGIDSDTDLLQLTSGTLVVNGSLRLGESANIGIESDTNLLQLIDSLLVVNGDILSTNIKIADYDIYESATDSNASLRLNYHGYVGGTTQFRDLYIGDGKNAALAYFEGSTKTCTLAGNIQIGDDSNIGIDSDTDLLQLTSGTLVVNGSLRLGESANIGIESDTNLLQLIDSLLVVNGAILGSNIKIADYDIYESATDSVASLRLNYHGYSGGITQFRDLYIGDGKNAALAYFEGSTKTCTLAGNIQIGDDSNIGIDSDTDLLQLTSGTLVVNGSLRLDNSANIGIDSDTNLLQLIDSLLVVNGDILGSNIKIADYDIYESATDAVASLRLNYHGYSGGITQFRDLYIGDGKNAPMAYFEGSTKTLTVFGTLKLNGGTTIGLSTDTDLLELASGVLTINGNLIADDFYTTDWTDYSGTSTIVGWVATPTIAIVYKEVGDIVYVKYDITGTSNSATCSFTLPSASNGDFFNVSNQGTDNAVPLLTAGCISMTGASAVVGVSPLGVVGYSWTNSGTKTIKGSFWYRK